VEILITEGQLKRIIAEQTKPAPVKPKNQTYTTVQDRVLTKDTLTGGSLKIPKGTRFTAHQDGDKKSGPQPTYTASVDRVVNGKRKPSTVFYCTGKHAGKFWNGSANSWFYDKTKVLSGFLSKNLCTKSFGDQYYFENADEWREAKAKKEEFARCSKDGQYVNAKGGKDCYHNSTEYTKNYNFLKSQGLDVRMFDTTVKPTSANHHFNMVALFNIKNIVDFQANQGVINSECMRISLSSIKSTPHKSKYLNAYDSSVKTLIDDPKSRLYTAPNFAKTVSPKYANFFLSDFYYNWTKIKQDVEGDGGYKDNVATMYFPEGVYNFMASYYGTTNIKEIKNVLATTKPACQGGGMTPEQAHNVISTLTFISAFIPFVGPFIAAGLGTADAAILYSQGKKGEAALTAGLSLIPFAAEIPGLKGVGQEMFKQIAEKTISKIPYSAAEMAVVSELNAAKGEVNTIAKNWIADKTKSPVVKEFAKIAKEKGEEAILNKVKEKTGINKYVPLSKKQAVSIAKDATKDTAKELVKKYDA
jgi:hypothetical protein